MSSGGADKAHFILCGPSLHLDLFNAEPRTTSTSLRGLFSMRKEAQGVVCSLLRYPELTKLSLA